jgi:DNA-binding transcriptional ArsR family regulator
MERVWKALADGTRRALLDLLGVRGRTTGELCAAFPRLSRFAVMKHLRVLERARLVLRRREGRLAWNHLNAVPLRQVYERWVGPRASRAAEAMLALKRRAERIGRAPEEAVARFELRVSADRAAVRRCMADPAWRRLCMARAGWRMCIDVVTSGRGTLIEGRIESNAACPPDAALQLSKAIVALAALAKSA